MINDDMYITEEEYTSGPKIDKSGSLAHINAGAKDRGEIGIVSGDIIDAEMKHRLETLDKEQIQAITEAKDIVKAYNDFIELKLEGYKNKGYSDDNIKVINNFIVSLNPFVQAQASLVTGKSTQDIMRDIKDGFTYRSEDPQYIRGLLQARLKYAETTEQLLKQIISNNAKILKLSSEQVQTMIKGSSPKNIKDMKDAINKNKDQFIKNKYLADCRPIGAGVLICSKGFEIGEANTDFEDSIQDLCNFDLVVRAHGTTSELTPRADERAKKRIKESLKKSKMLKLAKVSEKEINDTVDDCFKSLVTEKQWPTYTEKKKVAMLAYIQKYFQQNMQAEKDHARWEFADPIKFIDGKTYVSVVKLVKAAKEQGFKKIKMYQCNPGEYDLPESLKPGVVFTQRTNHIESAIINDYDAAEDENFNEVYRLEQYALNLCDEYTIDYNDDRYLAECMLYDSEEAIMEFSIKEVLTKLIELIRKIIGAIIGFIKKIVKGIGSLLQKIKDFITKKDQRKVEKKVQVTSITMEAAKLVTSNISSQDELYQIIQHNMNAIAKEYKKVTDKQVKINKDLENQLQRRVNTYHSESVLMCENSFFNIIFKELGL